ncbi:PIG-L deacetylase family protein [Fodinibius sediminis]|uniref:N-acetylglucosaminyl deacetylase, LmbE family n=1 Tax=Fodinibius sediminis TaxID=1214077 RepID=A0A521C036_9BACT|nr:PIG-L family deacetylase [Fodinibius sediminis]SMO52715.1 N-acetylglucosaminyl deacetylase, LmbE family [Fodinibius sediminis]
MKKINSLLLFVFGILCGLTVQPALGQVAEDDNQKLRIIAFGAHPDDCELSAGGVGALWAEGGHAFKCVSMTNGDIGHFGMSGGELAHRRMEEVQNAADVLGITTEVMDIHDGELMPSLENRKKVARLIREWQADVVMVHRRYDYHPDHRYSGELVDDATILVQAKYFTPDTEPLPRNPVILYYHDRFKKPYPFQPDLVVGIDQAAEKKWQAVEQMPSQFSDKQSWTWGTRDEVPEDEEKRMRMRIDEFKGQVENQADMYRERLIELYGEEQGKDIQYAESFELSQYGRQVSTEELKEIFPTFN